MKNLVSTLRIKRAFPHYTARERTWGFLPKPLAQVKFYYRFKVTGAKRYDRIKTWSDTDASASNLTGDTTAQNPIHHRLLIQSLWACQCKNTCVLAHVHTGTCLSICTEELHMTRSHRSTSHLYSSHRSLVLGLQIRQPSVFSTPLICVSQSVLLSFMRIW